MTDNEDDVKENTSRGHDWEVVSLTASAYAASPGPKEVELKNDDKGDEYRENRGDISHPLFMSGHFVFPPSEHENLPIEPDIQIQKEYAGNDLFTELETEGELRECMPGAGLMSEWEQSIYNAAAFNSFHSETSLGESTTIHERAASVELIEPGERNLDYTLDTSESSEPDEEYKYDEADLPCGAWWKRSTAFLYAHAKETNSFSSIFIAATVMGLVILGHRWQQERWQAFRLTSSTEKTGRMLGPIPSHKDVIVGPHGRRQALL